MMHNPEERVIQAMKSSGIDFVASLPCEKVRVLLELLPEHFKHVPLTREEEGVGICAGAALAGAKPAMLIQNSGLGNMVNALASLTKYYRFPLALLISWRGIYKEKIEAQKAMGYYAPRILSALEIKYEEVHEPEQLSAIEPALRETYEKNEIRAVLFSPKVWETSELKGKEISVKRRIGAIMVKTKKVQPKLTRFQMLKIAASYLDGKTVVCNLGFPCKELYAAKHQRSNFYMLGSMGMTSAIALGIALNSKKEIVAMDGDGSLLMNPGTLATIAQTAPKNLTILAIDNAAYGSTGNQPTATGRFVDLEHVARGFGIRNTYKVASKSELIDVFENLGSGPNFIHAVAKPGNAELPNVPLSAEEIKHNVEGFLRE